MSEQVLISDISRALFASLGLPVASRLSIAPSPGIEILFLIDGLGAQSLETGQGLNLGLGDVRELVQQLHGRDYWRSVGDARLLRRYERARKAEVALMGNATDALQLLFGRSGSGWQGLRRWGMEGFERSGPLKCWVAQRAMGAGNGPAFSGVGRTF